MAGVDIVKTIMNYAREQNVTLIMVWKQILPRWREFLQKPLADELVRQSKEINVYIITGNRIDLEDQYKYSFQLKMTLLHIYLLGIVTIAVATIVNLFLYTSTLLLIILIIKYQKIQKRI